MHTDKGKTCVCDICGFKTSEKMYLARHMKKHQEKKFLCSNCEFSSVRKIQLEYHIDNVHQGNLLRGIVNWSDLWSRSVKRTWVTVSVAILL